VSFTSITARLFLCFCKMGESWPTIFECRLRGL